MYVVDAMIPVWKPDIRLKQNVEKLLKQSYEIRKITLVLSVDSDWDETVVERWFANEERVEIQKIPQKQFDHGGTRNAWAEKSNADILLFLVQDAVPVNEKLVEKMVSSLTNPQNAVVYARHIPGFGCDEIEAYTRYFNYPPQSERKTKENLEHGEIKACFTSNVCAAYRKDWYDRIGGFENEILLSEDSVYAAKVLKVGADVIYNAEAQVIHAHRYGYVKQWKRNFDIGAVHKKYDEIYGNLSSEKEGFLLVKETARHLYKKKKIYLIPRLIMLSAVKFLGYQSGKYLKRRKKDGK